VHHPGCDPHGLDEWRPDDAEPSGLPYGIPRTEVFRRYCRHLVTEAGLADRVTASGGRDLDIDEGGVRLHLSDGTRMTAQHLVAAVNPARRRMPDWAVDPECGRPGAVVHADDVDLRAADLHGRHITIVGAGLTAAHLGVGAIERGAEVALVSRRHLRQSMFDTDPGWLGPKQLRRYHRTADPRARLRACLEARDGGSVPPWMLRRLRGFEATGALRICTNTQVTALGARGDATFDVETSDGARLFSTDVWLATGTDPALQDHPLTAALVRHSPTTSVDGWPVLDPVLRWPGTPVHLLGRPAMLALGPAAGNLWGARVGAEIVADHLRVALGADATWRRGTPVRPSRTRATAESAGPPRAARPVRPPGVG
jgi:hypothetical protein